jgi:hypothetical protein
MVEAQLILASIRARYRLEPVVPEAVAPNPLVTLRPDPGPRLILHPR